MKSNAAFGLLVMIFFSASCQIRHTHVFGQVGDENKRGIANIKVAAIRTSNKSPSKSDTIQIAYTDRLGNYVIDIDSRKRYKNVYLVNPYHLNPTLIKNFRNFDVYKNRNTISDCCKIIVGRANHYGFVLKE